MPAEKRDTGRQLSRGREGWLLTALVLGGLLGLVRSDWRVTGPLLDSAMGEVLFWLAIVVFIDAFPVKVGSLSLTLDMPALLAVSFLYSPGMGALVAAVGAWDKRELHGLVSPSLAIYNRCQIAISVFLAGWVFRLLGGTIDDLGASLLALVAAVLTDYCSNVSLVAARRILDLKFSVEGLRRMVQRMRVGEPLQFLAVYFGYGLLGLVLAQAFRHAGAAVVLVMLVPLIVARQALLRTRELEQLTERLETQETLLKRALDRTVEERRDERLLVAGDLHDGPLQDFERIALAAATLDRLSGDPNVADLITEVQSGATGGAAGLRRVIGGLQSAPLGPGGLMPALSNMTSQFAREWDQFLVFNGPPADVPLSPEQQVLCYQVAREAVVNALKHAEATRIEVTADQAESDFLLVVTDDGSGFDTPEMGEAGEDLHFGLALARERAVRAGGTLRIVSQKGQGTEVLLRVPLVESLQQIPRASSGATPSGRGVRTSSARRQPAERPPAS